MGELVKEMEVSIWERKKSRGVPALFFFYRQNFYVRDGAVV